MEHVHASLGVPYEMRRQIFVWKTMNGFEMF